MDLADSVVEVELGGKVPLAVVGVFATDVVGVQGQQGLLWAHTTSSRVEQNHEVIKHIAHVITLETEFVGEVDKDVLDLFLRKRNLHIHGPSRVWLALTDTRGSDLVVCQGGCLCRRVLVHTSLAAIHVALLCVVGV